jgi:molybdenum cofactor biosynthesis enzyme MoaA
MSCKHCHIEASPFRNEVMGKEVVDLTLSIFKNHDIDILDLTGGAPELNPHFRFLIQ